MFTVKSMLLGALLLLDSGGFLVKKGLFPPGKGWIPGVFFPQHWEYPKGHFFPRGRE
jgi:hypothetical protein